ncbi:TetR/AcrR family transcriptional regulator [Enterovibrio makurazakiensis]
MMDELIFQIFLAEGWEAITYDRLAKELNVRKSSIQSYYPKNVMFATALQGRVFPVVIEKLDFSSKDGFIQSWLLAYHDEESHIFKEVVKMLLHNIIKNGTSPYSRSAIMKLQHILGKNIGEEGADHAIKMVLGATLYSQMSV